jgi:outer membrane protein assembly factor BamB
MDSGQPTTTTLRPKWSSTTRRVVLALTTVLACVLVATAALSLKGCRSRNLDTRIGVRKRYASPITGPIRAVEDWPNWRGPRGDGISRETDLAEKWPEGGPPRMWDADVGLGYSSPIAAGGRVYLFSLDNKYETLTCFDALTGDVLWNSPAAEGWTGQYPGARATPTIDGNAIYTYGGAGDLICRNLSDGKPRWQVNVLKLTGSSNMQWGSASSPLIANGLVYVQSGNGGAVAVAVNKNDGSLAWQSEFTGSGSYAPTILADVQGTPQLIVFSGSGVVGMNPQTGKTIWSWPWATDFQVNASTPVYSNGQLFITSSYGQGCMLLQLSPAGPATRVWKNNEIKSKFQQVILDSGHLYANSEKRLKCLEWATGKRKWTTSDEIELGDNGSLLRAGDKLILMGEAGRLSLARATPEKFELLSTAKVLEPERNEVWSTPLLYGGRLYVKGYKELVCFDVSAQPGAR